jgi:trimeric autotransporter adhesin
LSVQTIDTATYDPAVNAAEVSVTRANTSNTAAQVAGISLNATGWSGGTTGVVVLNAIQQQGNYSNADFAIQNRVGGSFVETFRITAYGDVGIGASSPGTFLQLGTYSVAGKYIDQATYPDIPSEHMMHITAPSTNAYYGGGISFGETAFTAANIVVRDAGSSGALDMCFGTGTSAGVTEKMRITNAGNVSIGNTNDTYKLDVRSTTAGNISVYGKMTAASGSGSFGIQGENTSTAGTAYGVGGYASGAATTNVGGIFSATGATNNYGLLVTNGNVGIGTTNPNYKLSVLTSGALGFSVQTYNSTPGGPQIDLYDSTRSQETVISSTDGTITGTYIASYTNHPLLFGTNATSTPTAKMVITTGGNVGIGTTNPTFKLDVGGVANASGGIVANGENFEKYLGAKSFADGVANRAINVQFGDFALGGRFEITITGTYNNANAGGGITKVFSVLTNPSNNIYTNESRVTTAIGPIVSNFAIGELQWDSGSSQYIIPISHIVSSGNPVYVHIKVFGIGSTANVYSNVSLSDPYTLTALSRNYEYYNNNVGIGTTSPSAKLDVNGDISITVPNTNTSLLLKRDVSGTVYTYGSLNNAGSDFNINGTGNVFINADSDSDSTSTARNVTFGNRGVEHMRVRYDGNVGIGTTNPTVKLQVDNNSHNYIQVNSSVANVQTAINVTNSSSTSRATLSWEDGTRGAYADLYSSTYLSITTQSSEKMRITAAGNVSIGNTNDTYKLDVSGTIRATGDVIAYSDARVKENVETIPNAIDKVKAMRGVGYNKIGEQRRSTGVIAQEILEVLPEVVHQDENGMYSVAYGNIVGVLIEAIKEQQNQIDELKSRLNNL